jgi:hypothetical protein
MMYTSLAKTYVMQYSFTGLKNRDYYDQDEGYNNYHYYQYD